MTAVRCADTEWRFSRGTPPVWLFALGLWDVESARNLLFLRTAHKSPTRVCNYTHYSSERSKTDLLWRLEPFYRWAHPSSRDSLTRCQHRVNLILHASLKETPERFRSKFRATSIHPSSDFNRGAQTSLGNFGYWAPGRASVWGRRGVGDLTCLWAQAPRMPVSGRITSRGGFTDKANYRTQRFVSPVSSRTRHVEKLFLGNAVILKKVPKSLRS